MPVRSIGPFMRCENSGGWPYRILNNHIVYFLNNHTCLYSTLYPPRITSRLVTFSAQWDQGPTVQMGFSPSARVEQACCTDGPWSIRFAERSGNRWGNKIVSNWYFGRGVAVVKTVIVYTLYEGIVYIFIH